MKKTAKSLSATFLLLVAMTMGSGALSEARSWDTPRETAVTQTV